MFNTKNIGWHLKNLNCEIARKIDAQVAELGINGGQSRIISFISKCEENGEAVCQKDIEKEINLRASSVSSVLDTLEKSNIICRVSDENNARIKLIKLTEEGKSLAVQSWQIIESLNEEMLIGFTEEEAEKIILSIERIRQNIKQ